MRSLKIPDLMFLISTYYALKKKKSPILSFFTKCLVYICDLVKIPNLTFLYRTFTSYMRSFKKSPIQSFITKCLIFIRNLLKIPKLSNVSLQNSYFLYASLTFVLPKGGEFFPVAPKPKRKWPKQSRVIYPTSFVVILMKKMGYHLTRG